MSNNLRLVYLVGFDVDKSTGRANATREKVKVLSRMLGAENFAFIYPKRSSNKLITYLRIFLFDLRALKMLFFSDSKTVVIQRVDFLPITSTYLYLRGISFVCEVHADFKDEIKHLSKAWLDRFILRILNFFYVYTLKICQGIIYNHPDLKKNMDIRYRKPSIFSYNGADPDGFFILDTAECRKRLGLDPDGNIFLFLGVVSKWHGVDLLIDVFESDVLLNSNSYLLIVGGSDQTYIRDLKRRAETNKRIVFYEYVEKDKAVLFVNAADVCLLPVNEIRVSPGSPLKLYSYIACGKPVVTQAGIPGYADEVQKYKLGFVTDFHKSAAAASDLSEIVKHLDRGFYKLNNRDMAVNYLSWNNRMEDWIRFVKRI